MLRYVTFAVLLLSTFIITGSVQASEPKKAPEPTVWYTGGVLYGVSLQNGTGTTPRHAHAVTMVIPLSKKGIGLVVEGGITNSFTASDPTPVGLLGLPIKLGASPLRLVPFVAGSWIPSYAETAPKNGVGLITTGAALNIPFIPKRLHALAAMGPAWTSTGQVSLSFALKLTVRMGP